VPLSAPLSVDEEPVDLTVQVHVAQWFLTPSGGLYSPAQANTPGQARARVANNIRSSFRASRDRNRDGRDND
jgi:hypothetical protein